MNCNRYSVGRLLMMLLIISLFATQFALAEDAREKVRGLQFTAHPDGTFSVESQSVPLDVLLSKIGEATNVVVHVDAESNKRLVTISVKSISLIQLLKRIAGANYAMVYDGGNISALYVLPKGKDYSITNAGAISEFSGQVKISNQRARMFFMPVGNSKIVVDNYINKRHEALAKLSAEDPQKQLSAQISFNGYLSSDQIVELVKENQLDPVTLNIGWKENGGGYDLTQGESIENAVESAAMHHKRFVEQL